MKTVALVVVICDAVLAGITLLVWSYCKHKDRLALQRGGAEDRAVAALDALWELPAFDRRQAA